MRRVVPVDGRQGDWPRLVANAVNEHGKALSALEGQFAGLGNYADDTAAAAGGVAIGGFYRNGSVLMVRVA